MTPESERRKDVWDLLAFGQTGWLYFTKISQPWLREAAKQWALDDMPRRRGSSVGTAVQAHIRALNRLSESLRLQRPDRGEHLTLLGRDDIVAYLNRMAYLEQQGTVTLKTRREHCVDLRRMLTRMRAMSLTRPGRLLHGLADDFALGVDDVPAVPDEDEVGHDLPVEVMQALCAHLPWLEQGHEREIRLAVELVIDTGRRPVEICRLAFDCLERDEAGKPVLVYDNFKSHRYGRRLPIAEATAGLITAQQDRLRAKYPDTPPGRLKLLPTSYRCLDGTRPISVARLQALHRAWVESLPQLRVPTKVEVDGQPVTHLLEFDKNKIFLYAYRHTYAQRHADAGVPPDILQQLMDHDEAVTTQQYYRVGEQRRREAVERVTAMQFDRHGNRVWRTVKALLDTERLRRAVGEVAVPYGLCSEPSNVAAGGHDCPVRFRCVGCGHFSTDVSYLPDLEAYLADLLRNRERLVAVVEADAWAKAEAMPSDEEIRRVRRLINRVKDSVNELSEQERTEIEQATALVRRARNNVVHLGLPAVRQPLVDFRPDRTS
ncbi:tyrosine-type recombinase/integrase [Kitasatospora sp. NPDC101235]|uniref:tyrosine-type recombinase/integrase n=1 Tax=Kitasatospora sp. NPDC101235 TaxID=3364101 RepID=UPI00382226C9